METFPYKKHSVRKRKHEATYKLKIVLFLLLFLSVQHTTTCLTRINIVKHVPGMSLLCDQNISVLLSIDK